MYFRLTSIRLAKVIILSFAFTLAGNVLAEATALGIIYPKVRAPYNQIFLSMIEGIEEASNKKVYHLELEKGTTIAQLNEWLKQKNIYNVIALGNRGLKLGIQLKAQEKFHVIGGATLFDSNTDENISGISVAPSPAALFKQLIELSPNVKKLNVIYEPSKHQSLILTATEAAKALGLSFEAQAVSETRELAIAYRKTLESMDEKTDSLWLPYSGRPLENVILNEVLQISWKRNLIVFSSNLADVNKGILFSLYPDNRANGLALAKLLQDVEKTSDNGTKVLYSSDLESAINTRTADHLKINVSSEKLKEFKMIFPISK